MSIACVIDVQGTRLTKDEIAFFKDADPWAFILFGRSCESVSQLKALTDEIRQSVGRNCLIFLDQEGGRVQRLKPPIWPQWPTYKLYGQIYDQDKKSALEAVFLHHRLIAHTMREVGIDADCAPCVDLTIDGAHSVIGDRAFSNDPSIIAELAQEAINGLHSGGVASCIKHIPGHGRAKADSHHELPIVDEGGNQLAQDFAPFRALNAAPIAMTAHVKYSAIDKNAPATLSKKVISEIIRGDIGFDGLLLTDDISMKALTGSIKEKAQNSIAAGCDVPMLCNAPLEERMEFVAACPALSGKSLERAKAAEAIAHATISEFDAAWHWARFAQITRLNTADLTPNPDPTERA